MAFFGPTAERDDFVNQFKNSIYVNINQISFTIIYLVKLIKLINIAEISCLGFETVYDTWVNNLKHKIG